MKRLLFSAALLLTGCTQLAAWAPTPVPAPATPAPLPVPALITVPTELRCVQATQFKRALVMTYTSASPSQRAATEEYCRNVPLRWTREPLDTSTNGYVVICDGALNQQAYAQVWGIAVGTEQAYDVCGTLSNATYRQPR